MPPVLDFITWSRERIGELADATEAGRARARTEVTLAGTDAAGAATTSATRTLSFLLAGPADVTGMQSAAISARYPVPGEVGAESDKSTHVELADPTLPWRYSPAPNPTQGTGSLQPWIALVVGLEGTDLVLAGDRVTLSPAVQALHPLGTARWAHVQRDESGRRVARVLSGRALEGGKDYLAVVVPAFDSAGGPAWGGTTPVTVPVYDHWRFSTALPAGGFRELAERLAPKAAGAGTGRAPVGYPRVTAAGELEVRGALAPIGSSDAALDTDVETDLAGLMTPARDAEGRPIVGLPRYGEDYAPDPLATTWGADVNGDPRHRGVAGLGTELGIRLQEELVAEAMEHAGALDVAAQRIRDLVLGLMASGRLWERRLPQDSLRRLWVLGPGLGRVVTDAGTVADLATAEGRPLPRGLFSSAARRMLRAGPARTALLDGGPPDPSEVLELVNRCPAPPPPVTDGVRLPVSDEAFEELRRRALDMRLDFETLADQLRALDLSSAPGELSDIAEELRARLVEAAERGQPSAYARGLELLLAAASAEQDREPLEQLSEEIRTLLQSFDEVDEDWAGLLEALEEPREDPPPCDPVDLEALAKGVAAAFDPRGDGAAARVRVLAGIEGLDPSQPLAPPEVCVGLDRPVWRDLEREFAEWLLPGVGRLPEDSVIALETNPTFSDGLLVGYNRQLLGELRWRNVRAATGCTPLRVFWERANTADGQRVDDIVGIANWSAASALGDPSHRPGGAAATDLVVVVRGQLFLRYPRTLVYLVSAVRDGAPDFGEDPDPAAPRILPAFQGRIGADVTFFGFQGLPAATVGEYWVVFEEPPAGYRFHNEDEFTVPGDADAARWADIAFADPLRVLISGEDLAP